MTLNMLYVHNACIHVYPMWGHLKFVGVGVVAQKAKPLIVIPASHCRVLIGVPYCHELPVNASWGAAGSSSKLGSLPSTCMIWVEFWILALAQLSPWCCDHMGSEQMVGRFSLPLPSAMAALSCMGQVRCNQHSAKWLVVLLEEQGIGVLLMRWTFSIGCNWISLSERSPGLCNVKILVFFSLRLRG